MKVSDLIRELQAIVDERPDMAEADLRVWMESQADYDEAAAAGYDEDIVSASFSSGDVLDLVIALRFSSGDVNMGPLGSYIAIRAVLHEADEGDDDE